MVNFLKTTVQIIKGINKIKELPESIISIFGGSRLSNDSIYILQAHQLANILVEADMLIMTGGGPSIMHAANCGAFHRMPAEKHKQCTDCKKHPRTLKTIGIGVKELMSKKELNPCTGISLMVDFIFARKYLFFNFSKGFVIFPGGLGTMDELSDLLNLMDIHAIDRSPIILIGCSYWYFYNEWLNNACKEGLISSDAISLVSITDDIREAADILILHCKNLSMK